MKKRVSGMLDELDRRKDANNWHLSIARRKLLIARIRQEYPNGVKGIPFNKMDNMKIADLEKLLLKRGVVLLTHSDI